jgi:hypothetical protein
MKQYPIAAQKADFVVKLANVEYLVHQSLAK